MEICLTHLHRTLDAFLLGGDFTPKQPPLCSTPACAQQLRHVHLISNADHGAVGQIA